jgi:hypothetical protein
MISHGGCCRWRKVVAVVTAQHMPIRGLIEREGAADRFSLKDHRRAALEVLMIKAATRREARL